VYWKLTAGLPAAGVKTTLVPFGPTAAVPAAGWVTAVTVRAPPSGS
jgi:hypothetical protein